MRWFLHLPLLFTLGCSDPPDPCVPMCAAATALYGGCLADWGVEWANAGYEDEDDFAETCDTWAWQTRLLEEEAGRTGQIDATCRARTALFTDGTCDDFTSINWSELPWQAPDDTGAP